MNPTKIQIDLSQEKNVKCDSCQNEIFTPVFMIKRISALMSPEGVETFIPLQVFKCSTCDHINKLFLEGITN